MRFYLGTHEASWLSRLDVPLMVSRRRLYTRRILPRARAPWVLDSGGFTELSTYGRWTIEPSQYVAKVRLYRDEIGGLEWAAPMDWMCEPFILAKTGQSVADHQLATVRNFVELRAALGPLIIPVLQGYTIDDYHRCVDLFAAHDVDLRDEMVVGVGSVCRRQNTDEIERILASLHVLGIGPMHGFGVKTTGLDRYGWLLGSADSLAWSYNARRNAPMAGCHHKSCANCPRWAVRWRERLLTPERPSLFWAAS